MKRTDNYKLFYLLSAILFLSYCSCNKKVIGNISGEKFDKFHERFFADSMFQKSRIDFPLPGKHYKFIEGEFAPIELTKWQKDEWTVMKNAFKGNDTIAVYGNDTYKRRIRKTDTSVTETIFLVDSGFKVILKFGLNGRKWYLKRCDEFNF